ncbi:MAG: ImmA/IrrE family metallo-endopeptidase [Thermodesulfobacteriota bacterium]
MNTTVSRPVIEAQKVLMGLLERRRREMGLDRQPTVDEFYPVNVEDILYEMGWHIERVPMVGHTEDFLPADGKVDFDEMTITIEARGNVPKGRTNWTLAHELGHIVLHGKEGQRTLLRTRSMRRKHTGIMQRDPLDVEADRFAAELLMPSKAVKIKFREFLQCNEITVVSNRANQICSIGHPGRISEPLSRGSLARTIATYQSEATGPSLVTFFDVSVEAMTTRLLELGIVLD